MVGVGVIIENAGRCCAAACVSVMEIAAGGMCVPGESNIDSNIHSRFKNTPGEVISFIFVSAMMTRELD